MRLTKKKGTTMLLIRPLGEGACTKWTVDLHAKFMEVMQKLGEGGMFTSQICCDFF